MRAQSSAISRGSLEPRALAEERDGLRRNEGRHLVLHLALHSQELTARADKGEVGAGLEKHGQLRRCLHHLLEVIEQQEQLAHPDVLGEPVLRAEGLRDRLGHEGGVAERSQPDPEDTALVLGHERRRRLDREPRLPRAAGAGKRQQPRSVLDARDHLCELSLSADERARRAREVRVRDGLERRERLRAELENLDGVGDVLQPVLAQIHHLGLHELDRRPGEDDLPSMAGGGNAGGQVDVLSDVAFVGHERRTGVQTYPEMDRSGVETLRDHPRGLHCARCGGERNEKRVALGVDLDPALLRTRLAYDPPVLRERLGVPLGAEPVQELRRALDVGEEEGDGPGRQFRGRHFQSSRANASASSRESSRPARHDVVASRRARRCS